MTIMRYPPRIVWKPQMRSQLRLFILCGMAELPTCPGRKPSVARSWPAIKRSVVANEAGAAAACTNADTTSKSSDRG